MKTGEDIKENKIKAWFKKHSCIITFIMAVLYFIAMGYIGNYAGEHLIKLNYLNIPYVGYAVGLVLMLVIAVITATVFGNISVINEIYHTSIARLLVSLVFCILIQFIYRDIDAMIYLSIGSLILAIFIHGVAKSVKVITGNRHISSIVTAYSLIVAGIGLGISALWLLVTGQPVQIAVVSIAVIVVIHLISLIALVRDTFRYYIVSIISFTILSITCLTTMYSLTGKNVIKQYFLNGYSSLNEISTYEAQKGNIYSVYKATGLDIKHITDDNNNYKNLHTDDTDYRYSLYASEFEYIVFDWNTIDVVQIVPKSNLIPYMYRALSDITTEQLIDYSQQDGTINVLFPNDRVLSLYVVPTEKGVSLKITDKDLGKFGITYQPKTYKEVMQSDNSSTNIN